MRETNTHEYFITWSINVHANIAYECVGVIIIISQCIFVVRMYTQQWKKKGKSSGNHWDSLIAKLHPCKRISRHHFPLACLIKENCYEVKQTSKEQTRCKIYVGMSTTVHNLLFYVLTLCIIISIVTAHTWLRGTFFYAVGFYLEWHLTYVVNFLLVTHASILLTEYHFFL